MGKIRGETDFNGWVKDLDRIRTPSAKTAQDRRSLDHRLYLPNMAQYDLPPVGRYGLPDLPPKPSLKACSLNGRKMGHKRRRFSKLLSSGLATTPVKGEDK